MKLVFEDHFTEINLDLWKTRMKWGIIHPKRPWLYSDESCLKVKNGILEISTKFEPKEITYKGIVYHPDFARGVLESKLKYGKGKYQFRCNVPKNTWCAVWLYGGGDEIDIMEVTRKEGFSFGTHLHIDNYTSRTDSYHKVEDNSWHTFELIWNNDMIFKMDGKIIRVVKNPDYISTEQYLVLSTSMHKDTQPTESFLIDYIKYETTN